jgi:murein DD-endopeptidase MepM/ murein hydrolase activator NlpD
LLWSATAHAEVKLDGALVQGALVLGHAKPGTGLKLDGRPVRQAPDGRFVIGFGREATQAVLEENGVPRTLKIAPRKWDIQKLEGLPPAQVTPPPEVLERIRRENGRIAEVRTFDTPETFFLTPHVWPADGPVSGVYGSQRILNGQPRAPHFGLDVAAPTGAPVRASAGGIVAMAEPDLYFTGGTVVIDHGYGVTGLYAHLSRLDVREGQRVERGQQIGAVGATGRVTGPHLHWQVNWFDVKVDPQLLLPKR